MSMNGNSRDTVYIARQPIFHPSGRVFGYELLYRAEADDAECTAGGDMAGARVLTDTVLNLGLDVLTDGHTAFLNLTRRLLLDGAASLLPRESTVFELLENIEIDTPVIDACRVAFAKGYSVALDDFVIGSEAEALLPYVKFIKVDVLATPAAARGEIARRFLPMGLRLIAKKVETADVAAKVSAEGYELVQGHFYCKPTTFDAPALPSRRLVYLNLLCALNGEHVTIDSLEDLIKHDASLSYRVLRSVNSAAFALSQEIRSIRQAIVLLGLQRIRQWASVWSMAELNSGGTSETVAMATLRGRCCELLGDRLCGASGSEFFMLGLCSLLDAMLGRPMATAIADLPLSAPIRAALLGQSNLERSVLDAVVAYEHGDWDGALEAARRAGISSSHLPDAYAESLQWARELARVPAVAA